MYGVLGLSIFVPTVHGVMLHGWATRNERMSLIYFLGLGILNGKGTVIYTARIPERCILADLTSMDLVIRLCMSWLYVTHFRI